MTKNKRYIWAIYHGFGIWQYFEELKGQLKLGEFYG